MDMFFLGNMLMLLGAFGLQFGLLDGDSATEETDALYDPSQYSTEFLGTDGDDTVDSGSSPLAEAFFLGAGNDMLNATSWNDYAEGGAGDDEMLMRLGDDIALGEAGEDTIDGGLGNDTLYGGDGNDEITGNKDDDEIYGEAGDDTLTGSHGNDLLDGGSGDDVLYGNLETREGETDDGNDTLLGGDGDDTMHIAGGDMATGGAGADTFMLYDPQDSGTSAIITDYNADEDVIGVIYTPLSDPESGDPIEPELTVVANAEGDAGIVLLDGIEIANIAGGQDLTPDDIVLIPEAATD